MAHTADRWLLSAAALWLHWLLLTHAGLCPDTSVLSRLPTQCQKFSKVCLDQNVYVLYQNQANPRHELFRSITKLQLRNITVDYYGFGDVWGTHFEHPPPLVRPATGGEETRELAQPQFSRCSIPMVIYSSHLYMYSRFFAHTVTAINMMQQAGVLDNRLSLVLDTFGMKLQPFHSFLLAPFTPFDITTLSHMSSRQLREQPESYSPDGQHTRCFWNLLACQFGGADPQPPAPVGSPLWSTGQAVFQHYKGSLPPIDPEYADSSKLRVLIGVLPRRSRLRAIVNQDQVWSWCLKFKPPQGVQDWNGTACLLHEFGKDLKADLVYSSQADVMIGMHGEGLFNAFFMPLHSSLIEIRPLNFTGHHPNQYMKDMAHGDGDSIFWWGVNVVTPAHSAPGVLELQKRGAPHTWSRERHTFVRLMALQYLLERITLTRTDRSRYQSFRDRREHYITDALDKLNDTQRHRLLHHVRSSAAQQGGGERRLLLREHVGAQQQQQQQQARVQQLDGQLQSGQLLQQRQLEADHQRRVLTAAVADVLTGVQMQDRQQQQQLFVQQQQQQRSGTAGGSELR